MRNNLSAPNGFLWGASSSAFQVEGECSTHGKGLSIVDLDSFEHNDLYADTTVAADHYNHLEEDVALMKELGMKSYRFSIAWTRILPNGNDLHVNEEGVAFYQRLLTLLKDADIEPIVTMYHFDFPQHLQELYGGWASRQSVTDFANYARILLERFGSQVNYWLVMNEQNLALRKDEHLGIRAMPASQEKEKIRHQMNYHMFLASSMATKLCHTLCPRAKIGPAMAYFPTYPESNRPEDVLAAYQAENLYDHYLLDIYVYGEYPVYYKNFLEKIDCLPETLEGDDAILKSGKPDFIAFNYYLTMCAKACPETETGLETVKINHLKIPGYFQNVNNDHLNFTQYGWPVDEVGFRKALYTLYDRYHLPLMITENGIGARDTLENGQVNDSYRVEFLQRHIRQLLLAMEDGVPVLAYNLWSFLDVLSTHSGFSKRYGLVYIDRDEKDPRDCRRIRKKSYFWYQKVIASNGTNLEI